MTRQENLIWLAGLIDGEGCIHAHFTNSKNVSIQIQVHCASKIMIDSIEEILRYNSIEYFRNTPFMQPLSTRETHRIIVRKKSSINTLLNLTVLFMKVKKEEAILAINFITKFPNGSIKSSVEERYNFITELKRLKRI